ncbi:MAG: trehalose-phosphatase [Bifidobacteriaceae bacterium]|jgi:trehalose-phosphatase|nr:trehalose-phosphatase [Bifidobacteriaceae bacterium]
MPQPPPDAVDALLGANKLLVGLDFDGTLAPLVDNPEDSRPLPASAAALRRLAELPAVALALVSGRPARDLARLAGPPEGTWLAGSHGGEHGIVKHGLALVDPVNLSTAQLAQLERIRYQLGRLAERGDGAWVETKPFAAVLHTRLMSDTKAAASLEAEAAALGRRLGVEPLTGHKVVELAVLPIGKAGALDRLKHLTGADRMVFIGDDTTDELAFRQIIPPDLSIKVGPGPTAAARRLGGPPDVAVFLRDLATRLGGR